MSDPRDRRWREVIHFLIVLLLLVVGCDKKSQDPTKPETPAPSAVETVEAKLHRANALNQRGDPKQALGIVQEILLASPGNNRALALAVDIHRALGRYCEAADFATTIANSDPKLAATFHIQAFEFHLRCGTFAAAEEGLNRILQLDPNHIQAHRILAQLLNAQGRRFEASEHVRQLTRLRTVTPDEVLSLIDLSGPFLLVDFNELLDDPENGLFMLGKARGLYTRTHTDPREVVTLLKRLSGDFPESTAVAAFRGRVLAELGRTQELKQWLTKLPHGIQEQPEYWHAVGTWLADQQRHREAIRALAEALRLDPTNRESLRRMVACLDVVGNEQESSQLRNTLSDLDRIYRTAREADADQAMWISETLQKLVRPWESAAWLMKSAQLAGQLSQRIPELNQRQAAILAWEKGSTAEQIREARLTRMLGFRADKWPLPDLQSLSSIAQASTPAKNTGLHFDDVAQRLGLTSQFVSGFPFQGEDYRVYHPNGGGLGVIDFDLDGYCDLYLAQAGGQPHDPLGSTPNQLFRFLPEQGFVEVAKQSGTDDRSLGQGICAGDVNQDGFPDLLVANVGVNLLFINQGDGTFLRSNQLIDDNLDQWTSTIGLADLDGDRLPDIIEVNYIDDPDSYQVICQDDFFDCQPQRFRKSADRVLLSDAQGRFRTWQSISDQMRDSPNLGFGLVIANFDRQYGNDFFIANDGDFNDYWISTPANEGDGPRYQLTEAGNLMGCSIGRGGNSQACMGIAAGDFNRDGTLDLHVTNFRNESVNLFLQTREGNFSDEAMSYGLFEASFDLLGWGTQAADFDNDGWLDLAVVNGHVFDDEKNGIPFRMPPQLFLGSKRGFATHDQASAGDYWQKRLVGRALAMLDFNRDGRIDLVANHLDAPTALLQNDSATENYLQLDLIGVSSERDAIGAEVRVEVGDEEWTGWQTGGDGHMCTNEPVVHFGLGQSTSIDQITIVWPSGQTQVFEDVKPNARYLVVEGDEQLYRRWSAE